MVRRDESLIELDRVVFDQQLREAALGGDVWLEVALVHPVECYETTFTDADTKKNDATQYKAKK